MSELAILPAPRRRGLAAVAPDVDVVVPVYNEEAGLERSIRGLHRFLRDGFPFSWRIVIADNASTDATPHIARILAEDLPSVVSLRLDRKGRGRALREAWTASEARVVAYMDVDLSTDLRALLPLVAPLLSGHSDLAIGTRLANGSRVVRGPKRELVSRSYNRLLRTVLRARFSDAQCGFKAVRREALAGLLPAVRDEGWFFDTELLVLAQRRGLRGVARLLADGPVLRFMGVGVVSTLAYALIYMLTRAPVGAAGANALALAPTAVGNTAANRRLTFRLQGREGLVRHHTRGALVFVLTLMLTTGALAVLHGLDATPPRLLELGVLVAATLTATVTRYVAMRTWVFVAPLRARRPRALPRPADSSR